MRTIDTYLDEARTHTGAKSDRALCRHLGVDPSMISTLRTKRAWPSDELMVKIAAAAGLPEDTALLDLSAWRTYGTRAGDVWSRVRARLGVVEADGGGMVVQPEHNRDSRTTVYYE